MLKTEIGEKLLGFPRQCLAVDDAESIAGGSAMKIFSATVSCGINDNS